VAADSEITFVVSYSCPRCGAALEARTGRVAPWLKCPKCQRASLPPEHTFRPRVETFAVTDDVLVIGPETEPERPSLSSVAAARATVQSFHPAPGSFGEGDPVSIRRVVLTTVLFLSVMMLLFAYLAQNTMGTSIASASALICLVLLILPSRS
jgi:hypothetical protein